MNNYKNSNQKSPNWILQHENYICASMAMMAIFLLGTLGECIKNDQINVLIYKMLNDLSTGILISAGLFPVYLILKLRKVTLANFTVKTLFLLVVFIQLGLVGYSLTTRVNLGADLIGYNLNDIVHTLKTSVNLTIASALPFFLLPLFFIYLVFYLRTIYNKISNRYFIIALLLIGNISWVLPNSDKPVNQNKIHFLLSDIFRSQNEKRSMAERPLSFKTEYPLEKPVSATPDMLSPYFNLQNEKPNIVIIMVEGLGSDFVGNGQYKGFTPYLDGLISKSLYWQNFLSNAGRTFGIAPSLLASLPFGEKGFMEMEKFPKHNSLISILKANGYTTSYFCGADSNFDRKNQFLRFNGIDHLIDIQKYGPEYTMTPKSAGGFSWGYPDREIFRKTLSEIQGHKKPRLDIIMTLTNHEPFDFPEKATYLKKVNQMIDQQSQFDDDIYTDFKDVFACLLYTDRSIQYFMDSYAKRPDYNNTIFVITGDHRLIPIPQKDNICRFHVPLYIYSPMLKKPEVFKSISSHRDITPSLVAMLSAAYKIKTPEKTSWLGQGLDTHKGFRNTQKIPFMRYKGGLVDYLYKDYFYSDKILYKVDENLNLSETSDGEIYHQLTGSFDDFKKLNAYVTDKDKIAKNSIGKNGALAEFTFSAEDKKFIEQNTKNFDTDQTYELARKYALSGQRSKARTLCNFILNKKTDHADARILKARTYAWDGDYKNAEKELRKTMTENPYYFDSYLALMDVYHWSGKNDKAIQTGKTALGLNIENPEIAFKLAQAYLRAQNKASARKTVDSLLRIYPENQIYSAFKKSI